MKLGDGSTKKVEGNSIVAVYVNGGNKELIHDVLYALVIGKLI